MKNKILKPIIALITVTILVTGYFVFFDKDRAGSAHAEYYLSTTQTASTITVQSNKYTYKFDKDNGAGQMGVLDRENSDYEVIRDGDYGALSAYVRINTTNYHSSYADATIVDLKLLENSPNRVVVYVKNYGQTTINGTAQNTFMLEQWYYIYPIDNNNDKVFVRNKFTNVTGVSQEYTSVYFTASAANATWSKDHDNDVTMANFNYPDDRWQARIGDGVNSDAVIVLGVVEAESIFDYNHANYNVSTADDEQYMQFSKWQASSTLQNLESAELNLVLFFSDTAELEDAGNTAREDIIDAWMQDAINSDSFTYTAGSDTDGYSGFIDSNFSSDGSYHLNATNNKTKFTVHGEQDAYAFLNDAGLLGSSQSITFDNESGTLADGEGTVTHWASVGNRLPYGSFDVNDPDVLFYWDMDSAADGQAPNKGVGPIVFNTAITTATGTAGYGLEFDDSNEYVLAKVPNLTTEKGSISMWWKPSYLATSSDSVHRYFFYRYNSATKNYIYADTYKDYIYFYIYDSEGNLHRVINGSGFWQADTWYYLKFVWNAHTGERSIYVNGSLLETNASDTWAGKTAPIHEGILRIGTQNIGDFTSRVIDELAISQDPNQPDAPSFHDTFIYTDKTATTLTGIPETGAGSIKWNHADNAPINQTTKYKPAFTIHDWHPKTATTGGATVDHLVLDLPLDNPGTNANAGKVYDKVSQSWIGTTSGSITYEQAVQGNGMKFDTDGEKVRISENIIDFNKGTIEFDWTPDFDWDSNDGSATLFMNREDRLGYTDDHMFLQYINTGGNYQLRFYFSVDYSTKIDLINNGSNINFSSGDTLHIKIDWHKDGYANMYINGQEVVYATETINSYDLSAYSTGDSYIGGSDNYNARGIIDNFRIYSDVILPYGAYFTGNDQNGDYSKAHGDVMLYLSGDEGNGDTLKIGSGTVTALYDASSTPGLVGNALSFDDSRDQFTIPVDGNIDQATGSLSVWFKLNTSQENMSADKNLFTCSGGSAFGVGIRTSSDGGNNDIVVNYNGQYTGITAGTDYDLIATSTWHHILYTWSNFERKLYFDGVLGDTNNNLTNVFGCTTIILSSDWSDSLNGQIDELYITSSPNTPQIPTAFGKPILTPQLAVYDGAIPEMKLVKTDYDVSMLNSPTDWVITYNYDVATSTDFLITNSLIINNSGTSERIAPKLSTVAASGNSTITVQRGTGAYSDDFKLVFSEADAGVSECYLGQGTAGSWGTALCSATNLLTEIDQNSVIQTDQTGVLNLLQTNATEVIIQNQFTLPSEATTTEIYHIFSNGTIAKDIKLEKTAANSESRSVNSSFTNTAYHPTTPSVSRGVGTYRDSQVIFLTSENTDLQTNYQTPSNINMQVGGLEDGYGSDIDADGFSESRGAYVMTANSEKRSDLSERSDLSNGATLIYHTIGTSTNNINATTSAVSQISAELWLVTFSGSPDLSNLHKRDKFTDGGGTQYDWNVISINDDLDQIIVGDQEQNGGSPSALNTNQATVGPWYNSLASWESAEDRDLTSTSRYPNGEIEMAECWPMLDTATVSVYGWETNENNYIKIYTPIFQRHKGKWDDNSYILSPGTSQEAILLDDDIDDTFIVLDGLQYYITKDDASAYGVHVRALENVTISNSIFKGTGSFINDSKMAIGNTGNTGGDFYIINNLIYDFNGSASNLRGIYFGRVRNYYVYNNTVYNCGVGYMGSNDYIYMKNNIANNCTDNYWGTFDSSSVNNISDTGDAPGSNSKNCTTSFVSTSTKDFHLASDDTCAKGAGTNLETIFSGDIDGQVRSGFWDIGADEVFEISNKLKFTLDGSSQTIHQPRFLINDWYPRSGKNGSEESYILFHDTMDSIIDGHEPRIGQGVVTVENSPSLVYDNRDKGVLFNETDTASFYVQTSGNVNADRGSVSMVYTPKFNSNPPSWAMLWWNSPGAASQLGSYLATDGTIVFYYGANKYNVPNTAGIWKKDKKYNLEWTWRTDDVNTYRTVLVDGKIMGADIQSKIDINLESRIYIGNNDSGGSIEANGIIDDFKIYSEAILPYGAYYTGYEQNGNYLWADPDITFYWDAESTTAKGGSGLADIAGTFGSGDARVIESAAIVGNRGFDSNSSQVGHYIEFPVSNENIIKKDKGSIGFWFNVKEDGWLFSIGDDGDYIGAFTQSDNSVGARYVVNSTSNTVVSSASTIDLNEWHYMRVVWADANNGAYIKLYLDGQFIDEDPVEDTWNDGSFSTLIFNATYTYSARADMYLDQVFITSNPNSNQIPTAFGKPIRMPIMKNGDLTKKYGIDYTVSFTPDPSQVIIQHLNDIDSQTIFTIGENSGKAQIKRLRGGVRLEGGVRF